MPNELSLNEFIKESILNIADGICEAGKELQEKHNNCSVAPSHMDGQYVVKEQSIKFDIAVTTAEIKSGEGNGKIGINVIGVSLSGKLEASNMQVSRIQFEVPFYAQALSKGKNSK